jgi:hypothetical protein
VPVDFYETNIKYRDVVKFHCGIEHVFFFWCAFRLGFYHDPNPISADMDRNWFTAVPVTRSGISIWKFPGLLRPVNISTMTCISLPPKNGLNSIPSGKPLWLAC